MNYKIVQPNSLMEQIGNYINEIKSSPLEDLKRSKYDIVSEQILFLRKIIIMME